MEKLIFERGRLILDRMLDLRKMMGLPYASLDFSFSHGKERFFQSLNFGMYSNHINVSTGHINALQHNRAIYSIG